MSKPIPVEVARRISEESDLTHVVIVGYDERVKMFQAATFGARDERDKLNAAAMGEHCVATMGGIVGAMPAHEDFRNEYRVKIALLTAERDALQNELATRGLSAAANKALAEVRKKATGQ